jgi:beta-lactamase class A
VAQWIARPPPKGQVAGSTPARGTILENPMTNSAILQKQLTTFEKLCGGILGVSATHIHTNIKIDFKADQRFFMCSTYKVAIAIYLLVKVEQGEMNLNDLHAVVAADFLPGIISTLNPLNYDVAQHISLHSLLRLMLQESCNTATAIIFNKLGGPYALRNYLNQHGLQSIGMDFYTF